MRDVSQQASRTQRLVAALSYPFLGRRRFLARLDLAIARAEALTFGPGARMPDWFHQASLREVRSERGDILGVDLICFISHDNVTSLPPMLADTVHGYLDRLADDDARRAARAA